MSTIQSLVSAKIQNQPRSEYSGLSRAQLEARLAESYRRLAFFDATEHIAQIGHYEWSRVHDRLESCSLEYARLFNMTVAEVLQAQSTLERTLTLIHPQDHECYRLANDEMVTSKTLDIVFRILLKDGSIKHVREFAISVFDEDGLDTGSFGMMQDISRQVQYERDLENRDEFARQSEEITDIGHFIYDEENGCYLYVSEGFARIRGCSVEHCLENVKSFEDDIADVFEDDRQRVAEEYRHYIENGENCAIEYRMQRPDGAICWVRELGRATQMKDGRVSKTLGVVQDITDQVMRERELMFKDAMANQAEAITDIGHFVYDEIRQKYLFASPGLVRILGKQVEELLERTPVSLGDVEIIHPDDRERVQKAYDRFLADGNEWQVDYRILRANGEVRWVHEMGKAHLMGHGIPEQTIGVLQDITAQKNAEQEIIKARDTLEQQVVVRTRELANTVKQLQVEIEEREKVTAELHFLANHDALTGLPSLRLCKDRLNQSLAEARRKRQTSAVMFLDLDGFKEINDRYGHEFGDRVLRATAERITAEIRETDTVARIGGDEFVIILSSLPERDIANRIARNLVKAISSPLTVDTVELSVSASVGISLYPDNGVTAEELIRSADKAMYSIKREGKNNFGFVDSVQH